MSYSERRQLSDQFKSIFEDFKDVNSELKSEVSRIGEESRETRRKLDRVHDHLDLVETKLSRPRLSGEHKAEVDEYTEAWKKWYCKGIDHDIKAISMNETVDPQGGYLVPPEYADKVIDSLVQWSPIRRYATVMKVTGKEFKIPVQQQAQNLQTGAPAAGIFSTGWTADQGPVSITDAGQLSMKTIPTCDLYAQPIVSQDLLDDAMVNMDNYIRTNLAKSFAFAEGKAFVNGDGVGKPTGLVTTAQETNNGGMSAVTATTGVANSIGTSPNFLIDAFMTLPDYYARNGTWLMNRQTLRIVREWVDGNGQYLFTPVYGQTLPNEAPATILERPYAECIDMAAPTNMTTGAYATGSIPIIFGDVASAYMITDRLGMTMLRDPYSNKPFIQFFTTFRVGGLTILPEALVACKVKP